MALVCRVGMVKCVPHQLDMFQNRIGVIKEITGLSHEEEMECHQSAHMKERMHNMTQIIDDSLNIKSHDDTVVTGKRIQNPTKKGKTEKVWSLPWLPNVFLSGWKLPTKGSMSIM